MQIEGSVRANLIAAIASARRWKGRQVHADTLNHWRQVLDHGRRTAEQPYGEPVAELITELETELAQIATV